MKLKEIEVGMVIHCETQEQAWELVRFGGLPSVFVSRYWDMYKTNTCYCLGEGSWSYCYKDFFVREGLEIIEFEDLIIDERETYYTLLPTKPVLDDHITCELMTGEVFDFGGMCNTVEGNGPKGDLLIFRYENGKKFLNLAAIPINSIKIIRYVNSREVINNVMNESESEEK